MNVLCPKWQLGVELGARNYACWTQVTPIMCDSGRRIFLKVGCTCFKDAMRYEIMDVQSSARCSPAKLMTHCAKTLFIFGAACRLRGENFSVSAVGLSQAGRMSRQISRKRNCRRSRQDLYCTTVTKGVFRRSFCNENTAATTT